MPCYHPLDAYRSRFKTETGRTQILFNPTKARDHEPIKLPCGQCVGCRLKRSASWATRCVHEAQLYSENCFITLTYADHHLPDDHSLCVDHYQRFMKRLRKRFSGVDEVIDPETGEVSRPIRFFHCGEYGENFGRPHYHALLFNFDFPDKYIWRKNRGGNVIWRSSALEELWPFGMSEIGSVTFESAAYVARYIMKKVTGHRADDHYFCSYSGVYKKPEYVTMSRRPGIAARWFQKYHNDIYPHDHVVLNGRVLSPPRFYDNLYQIADGQGFDLIQFERWKKAQSNLDDNSKERLYAKEQVKLASLSKLKRTLQ